MRRRHGNRIEKLCSEKQGSSKDAENRLKVWATGEGREEREHGQRMSKGTAERGCTGKEAAFTREKRVWRDMGKKSLCMSWRVMLEERTVLLVEGR